MSSKKNNQYLFTTDLYWTENELGVVRSNSDYPSLSVGMPAEFGGKESGWSPEHLFLSAIIACTMNTYLMFVKKIKFENAGFECTATGQVEMIDEKYRFTYIHLYPRAYVTSEADADKARLAMEKAKKYCIISNSVNATVVQHPEVVIGKPAINSSHSAGSGKSMVSSDGIKHIR